jgi:DNA mismatch repair protein MutL
VRASSEADGQAAPADLAHQQRTREALADYLKSIDPTQARIEFRPPRFSTERMRPSIVSTFSARQPDRMEPNDDVRLTDGHEAEADRPGSAPPTPLEPASVDRLDAPAESVLQVHNTYIVAQTDAGLVIIDQHALHERILYERFRARVLSGPLESQRLLIPQSMEVSSQQAQAARQHEALLHKLGIEVGAFGPAELAVQAFPTLLDGVEIRTFVADLLDKLVDLGDAPGEETLIHAALDMMACKAAVKAGDPLSREEMQALLAHRHVTERASNCPHGRPTSLQLTTRDLEKQFKRV